MTQTQYLDAVAAGLQEFLSDPAFAAGRAQQSLQTLSAGEPAGVWMTTAQNCRALIRDALGEIDAFYGTDSQWQNFQYVTIAIGPHLAVYDAGWTGHARPIAIFNASDASFVALIHTSL